ncbi:chain-length determining protein [Ramlibacter sp. PS3R-8]|uniref:chain-length determining protein n=1 Tax=Ramlibacter sp. PS3R-8 TaxID=3133437 RepID=UPI0030AADE75
MDTVTAPEAERPRQAVEPKGRAVKVPIREPFLKRAWKAILRRPIFAAGLLVIAIGSPYWLFFASDRFVSEAHVIVQKSELAGTPTFDMSSLLGGTAPNKSDQLLLRDFLLSMDMSKKLDQELGLRKHFSDGSRDPFSRFWFASGAQERFHQYYLSRVSVEMDEFTGVVVIKAQAYDAAKAHAIAQGLVSEGERFMNRIAQELAQRQVTFLEQQVTNVSQRAMRARQALLEYQNRKGLVSPQETATSISGVVARLEAQRSELETQRRALQSYLVANHPNIVQLDQQIDALNRQADMERAKLTAPSGRGLNRTVEEFQRLEMEATFVQDMYKTSLTALESGRVEATRTVKQVSVIQTPTKPEYAVEPRRIYNTALLMLLVLLLAGVGNLLVAIVRDHKD